jgi:peptidoglycan/LPS O-acetylase OafA/YrhL
VGRVYEGGSGKTCAPVRVPIEPTTPRRLGYQPALDGVRGLAVALVVVFHLDAGVFTGGYLGVSVFFTLSGFLITTLLVERFHDTGELGLGGFYVRRIKRLVPASAATLLVIAALTAGGGFLATDRSKGDLVAAALNVFNWREVASGRAYADLFAGDSPVAHFWSLAIEEQFYVVWPLALLVLLRSRRIGPARLLTVVSVLFLASAIAAQFGSSNVAYFASWTRAAEILAGACLAVWLRRVDRIPTWWRHLAGPAIGLVVILSLVTPAATGWAYSGGLPIFSLVSVALIAGLQTPGATRTALSFRPLVGLGRISYGVYLVHWPVFVFVDEVRMGVDGWNLAVTRVGLTAMISIAMYVVLERPIRLSARPVSARPAFAMVIGVSLAIVAVTHIWIDGPAPAEAAPTVLMASSPAPATTSTPAITSAGPAPSLAAPNAANESVAPPDPEVDAMALLAAGNSDVVVSEDPVSDEPTTLAVFGDSVPAWLLRDAARAFERRDVVLINGASEACDGAVALPLGRDRRRVELRPPDDCLEWTQSYPVTLSSYDRPVEVGLLVIGQAATVDRFIDERWSHPCEADSWYLDDVRERIKFLRAHEVEPMIALPARFGQRATFILPDDHAERMSCVRTSLVAIAFEQQVHMIDLDGLLCVADDCDGRRKRDGIHIDPEVASDVLDELVDLTLAAR